MERLGGPPKLIEMTEGLPVERACTAAELMPEMMADEDPEPLSFMTLTQKRLAFFATPKTLPPIVPATWVPSGRRRASVVTELLLAKGKKLLDINADCCYCWGRVSITFPGGHNASREHWIQGEEYSRPFPSAQREPEGKQLARPANS